MNPNQPGDKKMPDFKDLNDRIISEHSIEPTLVIKTNLDPKDVTENNPYYHKRSEDEREFRDYFQE